MICPIVRQELVHFIHGELDPDLRIGISTHLASCEACRHEWIEIENTLQTVISTHQVEASDRFRSGLARKLPEVYGRHTPQADDSTQPVKPPRFFWKPAHRVPLLAASLLLHATALGLIAHFLLQDSERPDRPLPRVAFEAYTEQLPSLPPDRPQIGPNESAPDEPLPFPERIHKVDTPRTIPPEMGPDKDIHNLARVGLTSRRPQNPKLLATWLRQRLPDERILALGAHRRIPAIDRAIGSGLNWLAAHQQTDGSWKAESAGESSPYRIGVTGLATLAFLAEGHPLHDNDPHEQTVRRAVHFLEQQLTPDGLIGPSAGGPLYNHSIALAALVEARMMLPGPSSLLSLQPAVDLLVGAQTPEGGWGYGVAPGAIPDTSVTGWVVAALWLSRRAGLQVPSRSFERSRGWLQRVTDPATGRVGYRARNDYSAENGAGTTAVGLYLAGLLEMQDEALQNRQIDFLTRGFQPRNPDHPINYYTLYHATAALHRLDGTGWARWFPAVRQTVLDLQEQRGRERKGSWPPSSRYGRYAGRVYTTSIALLTLQTPDRYR